MIGQTRVRYVPAFPYGFRHRLRLAWALLRNRAVNYTVSRNLRTGEVTVYVEDPA